MIVVYEKGTNKIIGKAPQVYDSGKMRDYKMEELYPQLDPKTHDSFIVKDTPENMDPSKQWKIKLDNKGNPKDLEPLDVLRFEITTNAQDKDGDGTPEILVTQDISNRSRSWENCVLKVQLMEGDKKSNKVVDLRLNTSSGTLDNKVLKTNSKGFAETNIRSGTDTVIITISASAEGVQEGILQIEVLPVKDFETFHGITVPK
jgi:hypothetical protein